MPAFFDWMVDNLRGRSQFGSFSRYSGWACLQEKSFADNYNDSSRTEWIHTRPHAYRSWTLSSLLYRVAELVAGVVGRMGLTWRWVGDLSLQYM